jgi:hypothetical protein
MRRFPYVLVLAAFALSARGAAAGPPLLCHAIDIGEARSLPFGSKAMEIDASYKSSGLTRDTLELLTSQTPVLVRMETLRRAALYAVRDPALAHELLVALMARALDGEVRGRPDALAWFDIGYLVETYKESVAYGRDFSQRLGSSSLEGAFEKLSGTAWIDRALDLRGPDAEMRFAAALTLLGKDKAKAYELVHEAAAGAAEGSLLARNLSLRFGEEVGSFEARRTQH